MEASLEADSVCCTFLYLSPHVSALRGLCVSSMLPNFVTQAPCLPSDFMWASGEQLLAPTVCRVCGFARLASCSITHLICSGCLLQDKTQNKTNEKRPGLAGVSVMNTRIIGSDCNNTSKTEAVLCRTGPLLGAAYKLNLNYNILASFLVRG